MSSRGRPRKIGLSEEEIEQQNAIRLALQLKASKEKAAKRKLKNKGYTKIWKTHLRSKISKLSSKVKLKIAALNKLKIKENKIELEKQGLDVDGVEVKIEEVTFDHFTSGTFPWESSNESKAFLLNLFKH